MSNSRSAACRRYNHREDCTLLFDKHPLYVVEIINEFGVNYRVGDSISFFTTDVKPELSEGNLRKMLHEYNEERMEKIREDCEGTKETGLEYL